MKKLLCLLVVFFPMYMCFGQESNVSSDLQKVLRINILSPGVEYEFPMSKKSTLVANAGVGMQGAYSNLSYTYSTGTVSSNNGLTYYISPFFDLSYKTFYNRDKRQTKGKNLTYNSGNYWSVRLQTNLKELKAHNMERTDDISFAVGPTWGLQRAYGKVHFLFDIGPVYYFDTKGNSGFFPIMLQLNLGYNLLKR